MHEKKWSDGEKAAQTNWRMLLFFERFTFNGKTHQEKWMKIEEKTRVRTRTRTRTRTHRARKKQKERMNKNERN